MWGFFVSQLFQFKDFLPIYYYKAADYELNKTRTIYYEVDCFLYVGQTAYLGFDLVRLEQGFLL